MLPRLVASTLLCTALLLGASRAAAFDGLESSRSLGMANTLRASPAGATGLTLNPSGMPLQKAFQIEADYTYVPQLSSHGLLVAFVDSTSATRLAGGLSYQFLHSNPLDFRTNKSLLYVGHDLAVGLAYPLGDVVSIGATGKYQRLTLSPDPRNDRRSGYDHHHGNMDAGVTVTLAPFRLAVVGQNVINANNAAVPVVLGFGATVGGIRDDPFVVGVDAAIDFTTWGGPTARYAAGGEYNISKWLAVRSGYTLDSAGSVRHYASGGFSLTAAKASFDIGARQQVNLEKDTAISFAIRIAVQ